MNFLFGLPSDEKRPRQTLSRPIPITEVSVFNKKLTFEASVVKMKTMEFGSTRLNTSPD